MADSKKYYYLKLKDNFFDGDAMILLESMEDGYMYSNILLKLYLRSLKNKGKLMFNDRIPYNSTMIAKITRHSVGVVEKALKVFCELGIVEILDNGAIYMLDIQNFIGESSTEADRIRAYRKRIDTEKTKLLNDSTNVQDEVYKCTPKIEIEIDREIEIEKEEKSPPSKSPINYQDIIDTYNDTCISLPKVKKISTARKNIIKTRLKDYSLDEIKQVFTMAEESDFLKGKNDRNWTANFDWLMKDSNMAKVLDGNYKNGGSKSDTGGNATENAKGTGEKSLNELIQEELERQGRTEL